VRNSARDAIDTALEATVVGSFSRVGPSIRRRLFAWQPIEGQSVRGQVAVVTGASSGLGLECATELARLGAQVIILVRNAELGAETCERISAATGNRDVSMIAADLGDLESVRRAAHELRRRAAVHILIHNAGSLSKNFGVTPQGIERTTGVQLIGPFLLTTLIRDQLKSGCGRVVWVTSGGMYAEPLNVDWLESPEPDYDGTRAYAKVKRAQVSLNEVWAPALHELGITMTAMHPGWVDTPGLRTSLPTFARLVRPFLRSPAQGVDTIVWLVTSPRELTPPGTLWLDRRIRSPHRLKRTRLSDTKTQRARLMQFCHQRSGLDDDSEQAS
jgi:NAD(P)-dependent dehydrogenase (short-subunit alcohol dehydrogenase family)